MKVTLINPNIISQKGDFFGSGIPFMPITLAYAAAYLQECGHELTVIDAFGENPKKITVEGNLFIQGLNVKEIISRIPSDTEAIVLYASLVITHQAVLRLLREIRKIFSVPMIILENIHSVVGYSLFTMREDFFRAGADFLVLGDPEKRCAEILDCIGRKRMPTSDGLIFKWKENQGKKGNTKIIVRPNKTFPKDLDELPFPAWELFPIKNYWALDYSHAPITNSYLPLLTSRGCPSQCEFCITPLLMGKIWRARSAKNVVNEIEQNIKRFGVREFHIEDFNPTVDKKRIMEICQEIILRRLKVELKIVAGTKAETIDIFTLDWMKKAGFSYVSISPESGSKNVLEKMKKVFDHEHGLRLVRHMHKLGITSQACFVIGFPGEEKSDRCLSRKYIKRLVKAGIDEIALFVMTPIPGSAACEYSPLGYKNLSQLTFSPTWRKAYRSLGRYRRNTYLLFLLWKLRYHPFKLLRHPVNVLTKRFNTKMEMALWRVLRMHFKIWGGREL